MAQHCTAVCQAGSAVQCSAVQDIALVQCSAGAGITVQCSAGAGSALQCSVAQCSAVWRSAVQCSAVQCSAVQCTIAPPCSGRGNFCQKSVRRFFRSATRSLPWSYVADIPAMSPSSPRHSTLPTATILCRYSATLHTDTHSYIGRQISFSRTSTSSAGGQKRIRWSYMQENATQCCFQEAESSTSLQRCPLDRACLRRRSPYGSWGS